MRPLHSLRAVRLGATSLIHLSISRSPGLKSMCNVVSVALDGANDLNIWENTTLSSSPKSMMLRCSTRAWVMRGIMHAVAAVTSVRYGRGKFSNWQILSQKESRRKCCTFVASGRKWHRTLCGAFVDRFCRHVRLTACRRWTQDEWDSPTRRSSRSSRWLSNTRHRWSGPSVFSLALKSTWRHFTPDVIAWLFDAWATNLQRESSVARDTTSCNSQRQWDYVKCWAQRRTLTGTSWESWNAIHN